MTSKAKVDEPTSEPEEPSLAVDSGADEDSSPGQEEIFEVLSNERRRYVLGYLKQHENGAVDLGTLVNHVTALENGISLDEVESDARKSVYVGLRQTHLPKMDEYGLLDYDADRGTVELTDAAEQASMYLEYVPEHDIPWCHHYLGLSGLLGTIAMLAWFDVYPFTGLDGMAIAILAITVLALSAVVHTIYTYRHKLGRRIEFESRG